MSIFWRLINWLGGSGSSSFESPAESTYSHEDPGCTINPATGLPMIGGCGGFDVAGNPYGTDLHVGHGHSMSSGFMVDDWPNISASPSPNWDD